MAGNLAHGAVNNLYVVVHNEAPPGPEEWKAYVDAMALEAPRMRALIVHSYGGGPNTVQRQYVADMWKRVGKNPPIAVISSSRTTRGVVTALNWVLSQEIKAFPIGAEERAFEYLGLDAREQAAARACIKQLQSRLADAPANAGISG